VLHLVSASAATRLTSALVDVLAEPLVDPLAREWIAVPTAAMQRWLALELARSLGRSDTASEDGVCANITFTLPGALRSAVLGADRPRHSIEPFAAENLVWALLEILEQRGDDEELGPLRHLPVGAPLYGRARRIADLFDRYSVHRPDLLSSWGVGQDLDATGRPLNPARRWQPHLWRLACALIGTPSPPERLPALLRALRAGSLDLDLPPRLALFGITTLPGGAPFLELVEAVANVREVHLFVLDPSPAASSRARAESLASPAPIELSRAVQGSATPQRHRLLASWGRPYRERAILLAAAERSGAPAVRVLETENNGEVIREPTLLSQIQADLRDDTAPAGVFELQASDHSIAIHSCHGPSRQVEVLRDAILHLLNDNPSLVEQDIVILCPDIARFAPLIQATFGASPEPATRHEVGGMPRLSYRVLDRSLRDSQPVLDSLDGLLGLVSGRCSGSDLLDFCAQLPVRNRFDFDDDALATISDWTARTKVSWGLDGHQRAGFGLPDGFAANSFHAGIERLLLGVAVSDSDLDLAAGGIAPLGVEGDDITLAGRFGDLLARLSCLARTMGRPMTAATWCRTLLDAIEQLFAVDSAQSWQLEQLRRIIAEIGDRATVAGRPATVRLRLGDIRHLLAEALQGTPRPPDFFAGGVTVSSLTPLRGIPYRVVCLLGLDEAGGVSRGDPVDGDDLIAASPRLGDRDPRSESRQAILEAILAAGDHLVVTRTGHDIRTNQEVPDAVVLAELWETIVATLAPLSKPGARAHIESIHPRQPYDDACFEPGALREGGPWSFDAARFSAACARRSATKTVPEGTRLAQEPRRASVVTLAELHAFLAQPVRTFLTHRLGLHLPRTEPPRSDELPTELTGLAAWSAAERLIAARLAGRTADEWERHEMALGTLPAGGLGRAKAREVRELVDELVETALALGVEPGASEPYPVEISLADGTRVLGSLDCRCPAPAPGPARITYSRSAPRHHLAAWLDLVALTATSPATSWRSVVICRAGARRTAVALELRSTAATAEEARRSAEAGLEVALDCYRRGQLEPLPLFPTLSHQLFLGRATDSDWKSFTGFGDGDDEAHEIAFPGLSLEELCGLPARSDDPPGLATGRAQRYADYLWHAVEMSSQLSQ